MHPRITHSTVQSRNGSAPELITLAPLQSNTPLPYPAQTTLPSIRTLFPTFPPHLPPANKLPDISNLFMILAPRSPPPPPFPDNPPDTSLVAHVCAFCRSPNPTIACPNCHILHYCSATTCLLHDTFHPELCRRYNTVAAAVYAHPQNHDTRKLLIEIVEDLFKEHRTKHLLEMAIWHRNEIMRLSPENPLSVHIEFPYNLLRTGENDEVVSFIRHWAMWLSVNPRSVPGDRTYAVDLDRYEDALESVRGVVPLTHLVCLCLVKIRIIASMNARLADQRYSMFWTTNFGRSLSAVSGARVEDFFVRGGRLKEVGHAQVPLLAKYLLMVRERNPVLEYVIRDPQVIERAPLLGYEHTYGEAKEIWDAIGDLFMQVPSYPRSVF